MTVNGLNAYTDSSGKGFGNAKAETVFEMFRRITGGQVGIVSKAYIADATPAAVCAHTSQRSQYTAIIEQYLNGVTVNETWYPWQGVDLLFGGGAENFLAGPGNGNVSQFDRWAQSGYQVGFNNTQLQAFDNAKRALGLFTQGNVSTWLDQNVYKNALDLAVKPQGGRGAYDQPGLKQMTLKAIDILHTRAQQRGTGFTLMSEAAVGPQTVFLNIAYRQRDARS
jgi:alkaline phosphatase